MRDINKKRSCGLTEFLVFVTALICGTACSITGKIMYGLHGIGINGKRELFTKPIFQTIAVFIGMTFGLFMHWFVLTFRIPFPGYDHSVTRNRKGRASTSSSQYGAISDNDDDEAENSKQPPIVSDNMSSSIPMWMYFFLIIPAIFDLGATAFASIGLRYLDVSIYQLLRGSGIIYVALMRQWIIGDRLQKYQWIGVTYNVLSVILVGLTAMLNTSLSVSSKTSEAILGVALLLAAAFVQACQYVFEEKVMSLDDINVPPLFLIGAEGLWGTILCLVLVYPAVYYLPGDDHGSYEDPFNTWEMLWSSKNIQIDTLIYFVAIFGYNLFAVMVTFLLSSIWHSILDNFRPITVWLTDLFVYYVITRKGDFGEPWTAYSYIEVAGMFVLLYGTAIYNAPNPGSIRLEGQWYSLGLNYTDEFDAIRLKEEAEEKRKLLNDDEDEERGRAMVIQPLKKAKSWAERSPIYRYSCSWADKSSEQMPLMKSCPRSFNELV